MVNSNKLTKLIADSKKNKTKPTKLRWIFPIVISTLEEKHNVYHLVSEEEQHQRALRWDHHSRTQQDQQQTISEVQNLFAQFLEQGSFCQRQAKETAFVHH